MADEMAQRGHEPTPDGTPSPDPAPPAAAPPTAPAPEKTFTQAELNKFLAEERRKEREKHADYDALRAAADELKSIKDAQLSETEKLQKKLTEIQQQADAATRLANERLVRQAIVTQASKLNFADPDDAYDKLKTTQFEIEGDNVKGIEEAVKALAERSKHLLKNSNPALSSFNPAGGNESVLETDAQKRARIYGSGGHIFDAGRAEQAGGGVVWPKGPAGE